MIEFTRCPKCTTLYELEGVNLSASSGWVQCGECDRKFKAASHAIEPDELSFSVSNYSMEKSMKMDGAVSEDDVESSMHITQEVEKVPEVSEKLDIKESDLVERNEDPSSKATRPKKPISNDFERQQLSEQLQDRDSEFMEHTIVLPDELSEDEDFENIFNSFSDDIFSPELIDEEDVEDDGKRVKSTYADLHSEFSEEEIIVDPGFSEKTILEEELESSTVTTTLTETNDEVEYKTYDVDPSGRVVSLVSMTASFLVMAGLIAIFALQIHGRGTYQWIPQKNYDGLLSRAPFLSKLEKTQTNLSAIHLASTRMEVNAENPDARVITLQLINRSYSNQAYPDFQLEFTDAKGDTIARKIVLPSLYLEQGHLGLLESREAKIILLNLKSLPVGAVGYQIKVVQQNS